MSSTKIKYLFVLLTLFFISNIAVACNPRDKSNIDETLNQQIRPFLDSLKITGPGAGDTNQSVFYIESVFPASRLDKNSDIDYSLDGLFSPFFPPNERLNGLITEPIPFLGNSRIAFSFSIVDDDRNNLSINDRYKFTCEEETGTNGEKLIRQRIYLSLDGDIPFSKIKVGIIEVQIYDQYIEQPIDIGKPVYRFMSFSQPLERISYLIKDEEGVYSLIDFEDGSDRTFAEFEGGRTGFFIFSIKNMKYPKEALKQGKEATVAVSITITKKGKVSDVEVIAGSDPLFDKEAIRIAKKSSGRWIPATQNGKNITDTKLMSVSFKLEYAQ